MYNYAVNKLEVVIVTIVTRYTPDLVLNSW